MTRSALANAAATSPQPKSAFRERLALVVELAEVDGGRAAHAFASRTHAAGDAEAPAFGLARPALDRDGAAAADRRDVE